MSSSPWAGWYRADQTGIPRLLCEKGHPNIYALPEVGRVFCGTCNAFAMMEKGMGGTSPAWNVTEMEWTAALFHEAHSDDERVIHARRYRELKGMQWIRGHAAGGAR